MANSSETARISRRVETAQSIINFKCYALQIHSPRISRRVETFGNVFGKQYICANSRISRRVETRHSKRVRPGGAMRYPRPESQEGLKLVYLAPNGYVEEQIALESQEGLKHASQFKTQSLQRLAVARLANE
jgi:hypothetical protein